MNRNNQPFLTRENTQTLWDVIRENALKNTDQQEISAIHDTFVDTMQIFFENEKDKTKKLVDLNKQFILSFMRTKSKPPQQQVQQQSQQQQSQQPKKNLFTVEDIQGDRLNKFEQQYELKKHEFESAMTMNVPEKPDFTDNTDAPLGDIEKLIAETMRQRNYDIEQIVQNSANTSKQQVEQWLHPQETSLKNDNRSSNDQNFKLIKIEKEELNKQVLSNIINLNSVEEKEKEKEKEKKISWADNNETMIFNEDENVSFMINSTFTSNSGTEKKELDFATDIFSKLKQVSPSNSILKGQVKEERVTGEKLIEHLIPQNITVDQGSMQQISYLDKKIDMIIKNQTFIMDLLQKMVLPENIATQLQTDI